MNPYNGFTGDQRNRAQRWLNSQWAAGHFPRPAQCCACGQADGIIDAHAEDYSEPFRHGKTDQESGGVGSLPRADRSRLPADGLCHPQFPPLCVHVSGRHHAAGALDQACGADPALSGRHQRAVRYATGPRKATQSYRWLRKKTSRSMERMGFTASGVSTRPCTSISLTPKSAAMSTNARPKSMS